MFFKSIIVKILLLLFIFVLNMPCCFAQNTLSKIEINSNNGNNQINFELQKPLNLKTNVMSDDKMSVELSGVSVLPNAIYNKVSDVDNVVVENLSDNVVNVVFEGKNISKSSINIKTPDGVITVKNNTFPLKTLFVLAILSLMVSLSKLVKNKKDKSEYEQIKNKELARIKHLDISKELPAKKNKNIILNAYQSNPQTKRINIDSQYFVKSLAKMI